MPSNQLHSNASLVQLENIRMQMTQHLPQKQAVMANLPAINAHLAVIEKAQQQLKEESLKKKSRIQLFHRQEPSVIDQVLTLIKDGIDQNLVKSLQEVLNNAEVNLQVNRTDANDPTSRKTLDLHISVSATLIDKYAGLLELLLKQSTKQEHEPLIGQAHAALTRNFNLVQQAIQFRNDEDKRRQKQLIAAELGMINKACENYLLEHQVVSCCPFPFFTQPAGTHGNYRELVNWLRDIGTQELILDELLGAIYFTRSQSSRLTNSLERDAIRDCLDNLCKKNNLPLYNSTESNLTYFIDKFKHRAKDIGLLIPVLINYMDEKNTNTETAMAYPR